MKISIALFAVIALSLTACDKECKPESKLTVFNEGDIQICLTDVEENRCPTNSNCLFPGTANVRMQICIGDRCEDFMVSSNDEPTTAMVLGKEIRIVEILPLPESSKKIPLKDYEITLSVK